MLEMRMHSGSSLLTYYKPGYQQLIHRTRDGLTAGLLYGPSHGMWPLCVWSGRRQTSIVKKWAMTMRFATGRPTSMGLMIS